MHGHSNVDHHDLCKLEVVLRDYNFSLWPADILEFHQLSTVFIIITSRGSREGWEVRWEEEAGKPWAANDLEYHQLSV